MNKIKDKIIRVISLFTDRKLFVDKKITTINITPIKQYKSVNKPTTNITPLYEIKGNIGYFELYGTTRTVSGETAYKLVHKNSRTSLKLSEKMFNLLFERVK